MCIFAAGSVYKELTCISPTKTSIMVPAVHIGYQRFKNNIGLETLIEALQVKSHVEANIYDDK